MGVGVARTKKNTVAKVKSVCGKAEAYPTMSTVGQVVKTLPFHGGNRSSILLQCIVDKVA